MAEERFLIVNADDLGMTAAVNEGIFAAHEEGVVTSASLMVRQSAAPAAAEALPAHPDLALGLHLDLGGRIYEEPPASRRRSSFPRDMTGKGRTPAAAPPQEAEPGAVEEECRRQLERFRELVGRDPTHLDSHKHVHEAEPVKAVAEAIAAELGVPLRNRAVRYEGGFYGRDAISPDHLIELIRGLPPGWTEVGCHPAAGPVPSSSYDAERQIELATLRHPEVKNLLNVTSVRLCSYAQVFAP